MRSLELLRKYVFWFLDFLKGGMIRKHYCDIMIVLNHASSDDAKRRREKNLSAILNHAVATTPFYNKMNGYKSLHDFPVINKSIIKESYDSFFSGSFKKSELTHVITSGSTGTPFKVFQDKNKKLRNNADTIIFSEKAGYILGDRLLYLKVFVKERMKNWFNYWIENTIPVNVLKLDDAQIEALIHQIENHKSTYNIYGYASAIELVCKYLEKRNYGRVKANMKSVIAASETLSDYTKQTLQKYFGVPIVSRYSNNENGIIAQQETNASTDFIINTASYFVEILKMDSDEQSEQGTAGRIVITDMFNYAMPMIRYDTGDIGVLSQNSRIPWKMYLAKIEGRKLDMIYDTKGNLISSYIVYTNMWQYTEIIQYQLIQEDHNKYTFKINVNDTFTKEAKLIKEFKTYLGQDAIINVEYVSEIPLLSSGKRKMVVNNYLRNQAN